MVEAGAVRDQQRGQFQTVLVGGDVERRAVLAGAGGVDAGAVTQQHVDRRRAAVQRRQVQRRTLLHARTRPYSDPAARTPVINRCRPVFT